MQDVTTSTVPTTVLETECHTYGRDLPSQFVSTNIVDTSVNVAFLLLRIKIIRIKYYKSAFITMSSKVANPKKDTYGSKFH